MTLYKGQRFMETTKHNASKYIDAILYHFPLLDKTNTKLKKKRNFAVKKKTSFIQLRRGSEILRKKLHYFLLQQDKLHSQSAGREFWCKSHQISNSMSGISQQISVLHSMIIQLKKIYYNKVKEP